MARVLHALAIIVALWATVAQAANPTRTCRICEDVAQTYHDSYRCAGENVDLWGDGAMPGIPACDEAKFSCDKLTGDVAQACESMEQEFIQDERQARILWTVQSEFGKAYDTCIQLGKCEAHPNAEAGIFTPCRQVFDSRRGHFDIFHPGFTSNCTEECYLCTWLVREWPLFQEICTPEGATLGSSIDPDRTAMKAIQLAALERQKVAEVARVTALQQAVEEHEQEQQAMTGGEDAAFLAQHQRQWQRRQGQGKEAHRGSRHALQPSFNPDGLLFLETSTNVESRSRASSMARAWSKAFHRASSSSSSSPSASIKFGQVIGDGDAPPQLSEDPQSDLKLDCFTLWRFFSKSRKAKFFLSWKRVLGEMTTPADVERSNNWDANIACKCMGMCPLDPFEHLGLLKQCRYDDRDRTMMEYAFPEPH